jgi:hypothetical protein
MTDQAGHGNGQGAMPGRDRGLPDRELADPLLRSDLDRLADRKVADGCARTER